MSHLASLTKDALRKVFRRAERVRCPRTGRYILFSGGSGIILPALRPVCEVRRWTGTGWLG
jgi:hypothetical protein